MFLFINCALYINLMKKNQKFQNDYNRYVINWKFCATRSFYALGKYPLPKTASAAMTATMIIGFWDTPNSTFR